jgi:hypothetical protein
VSEATLRETQKGMTLAARNCGRWPIAGTLADFAAAAGRASAEADRAVEAWLRWRRRFDPSGDRLELGTGRINIRVEIAKGMADQLNDTITIFLGQMAGQA